MFHETILSFGEPGFVGTILNPCKSSTMIIILGSRDLKQVKASQYERRRLFFATANLGVMCSYVVFECVVVSSLPSDTPLELAGRFLS